MAGGGAYPYPTPGIVFPDETLSSVTPLEQGGGSGGSSTTRWGDYLPRPPLYSGSLMPLSAGSLPRTFTHRMEGDPAILLRLLDE